MPLEHDDASVLEIDDEAMGVFGAGGSWSGAELRSRISDFNPENADYDEVPDPSYQTDGGEPGSYEGVCKAQENPVTFKHVVEGLGTAVTNGSSPTKTALSKLLDLVHQVAADEFDGDQAAAGWTTTGGDLAGSGTHNPTGTIGLASFEDSVNGRYPVRPFTESSDTLTCLMALPKAMVAGNEVHGGLVWPWTLKPSALISAGIQFLGESNEQHVRLHGCVATAKIPTVSRGGLPVFDFSVYAADFDEPSETRVAASNAIGSVFKKSEVLIAAYGETAVTELRANEVEIDLRGAFTPDTDPNDSSNIWGFSRKPELPTVRVQIPLLPTVVPPAAIDAASYRAAKRDNLNASNDMHILVTFGGTPGRQVAFYWPRVRLISWKRTKPGGMAYQDLTFAPVDGLTEPLVTLQS